MSGLGIRVLGFGFRVYGLGFKGVEANVFSFRDRDAECWCCLTINIS